MNTAHDKPDPNGFQMSHQKIERQILHWVQKGLELCGGVMEPDEAVNECVGIIEMIISQIPVIILSKPDRQRTEKDEAYQEDQRMDWDLILPLKQVRPQLGKIVSFQAVGGFSTHGFLSRYLDDFA